MRTIVVLVAAISALLLTLPVHAEFEFSEVFADGPFFGAEPSIALGADNRPYITHLKKFGTYVLMFSYLNNDGQWVTERVEPDNEESHGFGCSLKIDDEGNFHLLYSHIPGLDSSPTSNDVRYAFKHKDSTQWQVEIVVDSFPSGGNDIAIDSLGRPHIVYNRYSDVYHAYKDDSGEWVSILLDWLNYVIMFKQISIDSEDNVYIAFEKWIDHYYYPDVPDGILMWIGSPNDDYTDWIADEVDRYFVYDIGLRVSMAIDSSDQLHFVRYNVNEQPESGGETNFDLWYIHKIGETWQREIIDQVGDVGMHCDIAIDPYDNLYLAYYEKYDETTGGLKFAYKESTSDQWQIQTIDSSLTNDPYGISDGDGGDSITVNEYGAPHIAYFDFKRPDETDRRWLKYVRGTPDGPRPSFVALTPGPNPETEADNESGAKVKVYWNDGYYFKEFTVYGTDRLGANVACGDVDGDGIAEIVTGPGPGPAFGPQVRVFEANGTPVIGAGFSTYGTDNYGVNVACGDIDGDGVDEIVTGAGPGAIFGPHVRAFELSGDQVPGVSFFAYGTHKYGINVACGDVDGDGIDEIITGAGPGAVFGPHVRAWDCDGGVTAIGGISFLAYGTNKFGVNVSAGDIDGDGYAEIVTGPGPGSMFGPHVRGWNYDNSELTAIPGFSFMAFEGTLYGAQVACGDLDADEVSEFAVGVGADPEGDSLVRLYKSDDLLFEDVVSLHPFASTHGAKVAIGESE